MIFVVFLVSCCFLLLYIPAPWLYGRILRDIQKAKAVSCGQVFLTFDDGPGNRLTPQIVEVLKENNIKGTFFILGSNLEGREEMVEFIAKEGHFIASHGFSHANVWKILPWRTIPDIKKGWKCLNDILQSKCGKYVFRPPYGKLNLFSTLFLWLSGVPIAYWTIDSLDSWAIDKRKVKHAAEKLRSDGGGIVLFHDFDRATDQTDGYVLDSLKAVIKAGQDMNLTFSLVEELFRK